MPTRHPLLIRRLLLQILSLMSKVCFGGFVVRIEQMFLRRCSFPGRLCGLLLFSGCLRFLIFAPPGWLKLLVVLSSFEKWFNNL